MKLSFVCDINNILVKDFLKDKISKNLLKRVKLYGMFIKNGNAVKNYDVLMKNDVIEISLEDNINNSINIVNKPIDIIYEDDYLLIINKENDLSVQPTKRHLDDNLASYVRNYYLEKGINSNIHIINRLDLATSGLVMIAKDSYIHHQLQNNYKKFYLVKVNGIIDKDGFIDAPIIKRNDSVILRKVDIDGKSAYTIYKVLKNENNSTYLEVELKTGRTHQIRVHMAYINHSVVGDKLYGEESDILYLHSYKIEFVHPITKKSMIFINYPKWYKNVDF